MAGELTCRICGREAGERHTTRCPHYRHTPIVQDYQCRVETLQEGRQIATQLVQIKARLGQLGLFRTMHALDAATTAIGYELAEQFPRG